MSTVTYDVVPAASAEAPAAKPAAKRQGRFARMLARMIEARQRQAMREVHRYGIILPRELDRADWKVSERGEDSLPFTR